MKVDRRSALPTAGVNLLLLVGALTTTAGLCAAYAMQYAKNAPFPPVVSISAYGLGPHGWVMTMAATLIGVGSIPLMIVLRSGQLPVPRIVPTLLVVWTVSTIMLGWVHTNQPHTPAGPTALLHQASAVVAMVVFPIAISLLVTYRVRAGLAGPIGTFLLGAPAIASAVCMVLLFFAAFGADTAGIGAHKSWALYQFVAAMINIGLVYVAMVTTWWDHRQYIPHGPLLPGLAEVSEAD